MEKTKAEKKNAVLEGFTGQAAGFDADGHRRADAFSTSNPGRVVVLNIHCGFYATGTLNYNVTVGSNNYGNTLYQHPDVDLRGFPGATINRRLFSGTTQGTGTAQDRGTWVSFSIKFNITCTNSTP